MSKYIQRPRVYNAARYDGTNIDEVMAAVGEEILEEREMVDGEYAVKDPDGVIVIMAEAVFLATYAPVPICDKCEHKDSDNNRLAHEVRCTNFDEEA